MILPRVLTDDDLPAPELQALRLDGELALLDGCFVPIDEVDLPAVRAASVAARFTTRLIACGLTAAWVHGVLALPPTEHELCVPMTDRISRPVPTRGVITREVVLRPREIVRVGPLRVTSLERTVADLARFPDVYDAGLIDLSLRLLRRAGIDARRCMRQVRLSNRLTGKARALDRLALLAAHESGEQAVVDAA